MVRVKILKAREIFLKFIFYLLMIIAIYAFLILFLKYIAVESKSFNINVFEENINIEKTDNKLNIKLIASELPFQRGQVIYSFDDADDNNKMIEDKPNNEINIVEKDEKSYLSYDEIEAQNRHGQYEIREMPSGKVQVGKAFINNVAGLKLNLDELKKVSDYPINEKTKILIFHTHTSEAYEEAGASNNFRTTDDNYNVVAVGETLKENLLIKKFDVLHNTTKHDTPSYNGAYDASCETVENILKTKKYDILIDLHRDALSGNLHYRPTVQINGETSSKLMFVIGTNASGLEHDRWMNNLKLALLIQNTAEEMYPGLFRDLNLAKYRYNQNLSDGAMILEVGSTGNTLDETKTAMKYLANVLSALRSGS